MPKNKNETLCVEDLRHAEYYEMQNTFDDLYAKSKNGDIFTHLMDIILSRENILLAYRNIKANAGSKTAGTDGTIIKDIGKLPAETVVKKVRYIVAASEAKRNTKTKWENQTSRYSLYVGQAYTTMYKTSIRTNLRS